MILSIPEVAIERKSILHVCGDDPQSILLRSLLMPVFSTYVEMILTLWWLLTTTQSILHVCGDDPLITFFSRIVSWYSPRMWRWSYERGEREPRLKVFSTYVEMILVQTAASSRTRGILHVCGDDPAIQFSMELTHIVFSTYVEMIPITKQVIIAKKCILHVCGDDPCRGSWYTYRNSYSPRMWRWS